MNNDIDNLESKIQSIFQSNCLDNFEDSGDLRGSTDAIDSFLSGDKTFIGIPLDNPLRRASQMQEYALSKGDSILNRREEIRIGRSCFLCERDLGKFRVRRRYRYGRIVCEDCIDLRGPAAADVEFETADVQAPQSLVEKVRELDKIREDDTDVDTVLLNWDEKKKEKRKQVARIYDKQHGGREHGKLVLAGCLFIQHLEYIPLTEQLRHFVIEKEVGTGGTTNNAKKVDFAVSASNRLIHDAPDMRYYGEAGHGTGYFEERVQTLLEAISSEISHQHVFLQVPDDFFSTRTVRLARPTNIEYSFDSTEFLEYAERATDNRDEMPT